VNKATIYREITFLLEQMIITVVHLSPDILHYELTGRLHHHHVVCTNCGKIEDINVKKEETLIEAVAKKTNFTINGHLLEFYGHCVDCK
jgi:Fe2+ or Zn2+ uptake regulation protein